MKQQKIIAKITNDNVKTTIHSTPINALKMTAALIKNLSEIQSASCINVLHDIKVVLDAYFREDGKNE